MFDFFGELTVQDFKAIYNRQFLMARYILDKKLERQHSVACI